MVCHLQLQSDIALRETVAKLVSRQVEMNKLDNQAPPVPSTSAILTMFSSSNSVRSQANLGTTTVSENMASESEKMPRVTTQTTIVVSAVVSAILIGVCMCVFIAIAILHYTQFNGGPCTRS